jgi:hypothetical protein
MAAIGHFRSLDKAIRHSLWNEPEKWLIDEHLRFVVHEDGMELVKPVVTNRWAMSRPLGYIRLQWKTHFILNAMVHGHKLNQSN